MSEDEKKITKLSLFSFLLMFLLLANIFKYDFYLEWWFIVYIGVSLSFLLFLALVFRNDIDKEKVVLPPTHPVSGVLDDEVKGRYE